MPLTKIIITDSHTHGKNFRKVATHKVNLSGGSRDSAAAGRKALYAKNMPPTQITTAKICRAKSIE